jgi:cyclic pyranopterin phosphate synthase
MQDGYGRNINYMRISVTDRCNLRCRYCMPRDRELTAMENILTYEEIRRVVQACLSLGIVHFRLTGGEPLVRREIEKLVAMTAELPGIQTLSMTSNGVLLKEHALALYQAGLQRINVSLDTVDAEEYGEITGKDALGQVLSGIEQALDSGLQVRLNAVFSKDRNYKELVSYAQQHGLLLRLIAIMPIGMGKQYFTEQKEDMLEQFEKTYGKASPCEEKEVSGAGPARYYRFPGLEMPVGFIEAVHHSFCRECNRIRLTSTGKLKLCLCYEEGLDVRNIIRQGQADTLEEQIQRAVLKKPMEHCFSRQEKITEKKPMSTIGG